MRKNLHLKVTNGKDHERQKNTKTIRIAQLHLTVGLVLNFGSPINLNIVFFYNPI